MIQGGTSTIEGNSPYQHGSKPTPCRWPPRPLFTTLQFNYLLLGQQMDQIGSGFANTCTHLSLLSCP